MTEYESPFNIWKSKADMNTEKWGRQRPSHVLLAMMEEIGELAESIEESSEGPMVGMTAERAEALFLLRRMKALGNDTQRFIDRNYDGPDEPVPVDDRDWIYGDIEDIDEPIDELDDLAALCIQMDESIRIHSTSE